MLCVKKYQIFEAHSKFKWDINLSKAFDSLGKREKTFEIRFSFGVCLVEPHDFYDLFCHGCKRKISKRKRTLVAIEPGTADEMYSGITTVIWNILHYQFSWRFLPRIDQAGLKEIVMFYELEARTRVKSCQNRKLNLKSRFIHSCRTNLKEDHNFNLTWLLLFKNNDKNWYLM